MYQSGRTTEERKKLIYFTFVAQFLFFFFFFASIRMERDSQDRSSSLGLPNGAQPVPQSLYSYPSCLLRIALIDDVNYPEKYDNACYCALVRKCLLPTSRDLLSDYSKRHSHKIVRLSFRDMFESCVRIRERMTKIYAFVELKIWRAR